MLSFIVLSLFITASLARPSFPIARSNKVSNGTSNSTGAAAGSCFPYGTATLNQDLSPPNVPRDQWFCSLDQQYGFQGFSYPLEDDSCSSDTNSFDKMNKDFARMKKDFGASIVRLYYPMCTQSVVFENALRAGVVNNMAVIPQIWFGWDNDNSVWHASVSALDSVMTSPKYGKIAPYVFHSADFGSEPVGDGVDGSSYVADLAAFKKKMNGYGIPVGISEDWDRPGKMSSGDGKSLGSVGKQIKANSDYAHAHIMPYYHGKLNEAQTRGYIKPQLQFLHDAVGLNGTMVTESQWAWGPNTAHGSHQDSGPSQYQAYWKHFDDNCETFKELGIGWFIHDWQGESTFDMVKPDGSYAIQNWKPKKC